MDASISLLLDGIGTLDAKVYDYRESHDNTPFDVSCVQELVYPDTPELDPSVLYVADKAALTYMAGGLCDMTIAFAGIIPAAEAFAPVERCRVVCVPNRTSAGELLNELICAQRAIDDLDARLIWASLEKDPLGAMLPIMAEHVHEPLLATDADDVLVAFAAPKGLDVDDGVFRHIIAHNCILSDAPLFKDFLSVMPASGALRTTVPLVRIPDSDREYLNAMVLRDGGPLLNILMSNEGGSFGIQSRDELLRLKLLIERAILAGSPLGFPPPDTDSCVRRLLDHIYVREEIIEGYLRKRGWHVDDRFYCVLAQMEGEGGIAKLPFLARQLRSGIMRDAVVLVHGSEVACVVRSDDCPYDIPRLSADLGSVADRFKAKIGVSCPFHDFRELRRYHDSCRTAISYGAQENPLRVVSFFDDYAARHLEHVLFNRSINEVLLDARAVDIKRHDDEQGQSLLQTLLVYLECGQNKTLAAKQLYIHRNTLVYRIGVIEKVAGIDLEKLDADRLFHLMYTCRYLLSRR